jgi:NitT/TauT family transport system permease protein
MNREVNITVGELQELEEKPKSRLQLIVNRILCFSPVIAAALLLYQYYMVPDYGLNTKTNVYPTIIGLLTLVLIGIFIAGFFAKRAYKFLLKNAPIYTVAILALTLYDYNTLKTGKLMMPYFPWPDRILNAIIEDRMLLLDCISNSLILLFAGFFSGAIAGLLTGVLTGWYKKVNYWVAPLLKIIGPIPSTTWLPIILIVASSLFKGSVFIIALGVWYPVTMTTFSGVSNVKKSFFEVARTLGAKEPRLIFKVAIPAALPNIFQGLTQGMSVACTTLIVAEMMGVESGLGWYINWQRGWAEFAKMYSAVIIICLTFTVVNLVLGLIKRRALRWQEGVIR